MNYQELLRLLAIKKLAQRNSDQDFPSDSSPTTDDSKPYNEVQPLNEPDDSEYDEQDDTEFAKLMKRRKNKEIT